MKTDDEIRVALMIALHGPCIADWAQRRADGAVALTQHGVDSHRRQAEAVLPVVKTLLADAAAPT